MARRTGGQKEQRIFFPYRVGIFRLSKEAGGIIELRFEFRANFLADFVATALNSGTDRSLQIAWSRTEAAMHLAHPFFDNALQCAAPSGVKYANRAVLWINQNHGQAVGRLNAEQQAGSCGDQPVTGEGLLQNRIYAADDVGMNLAERDQRPEAVS